MPRVHETAKLHLTLRGVNLTNVTKGWFGGTSSPIFKISAFSLGTSELWSVVVTSERIDQELNPLWPAIEASCQDLCGCDLDRPIQISVFDHDVKGGTMGSMGAFETTISALLRKKIDDLNNVDVSKLYTLEEAGKPVGMIAVMDIRIEEPPAETLKRGVQNIKLMSKFKNLTALDSPPSDDDKELDEGPRLDLKLRAVNLEPVPKGIIRGNGANPMYKVFGFQVGNENPFQVVFESETIDNDLNPKWIQTSISMDELCGGNRDLPIMISVYDKEGRKETLIGTCETTVADLMRKKVGEVDNVDASKIFKLKDGGKEKGILVTIEAKISGDDDAAGVPPKSQNSENKTPLRDDHGKSEKKGTRDKAASKDDRVKSEKKSSRDRSPPKDDYDKPEQTSSKDRSPPKDDLTKSSKYQSRKGNPSKPLDENSLLHITLEGVDLKNVEGWFGTADPFFQIEGLMKGFDDVLLWQNISRSEHKAENLNPKWEPMSVNLDLLCQLDLDKPIRICVFDWEESGKNQVMGHFTTTVNELLKGKASKIGDSWDLSKAFTTKSDDGEEFGKIIVVDVFTETPEPPKSARSKKDQDSFTVDDSSVLRLSLEGVNFKNVEGWLGMSDPMYQMETPMKGPDGTVLWQMVYRSEYIANELNPRWQPADVSINLLCQKDLDKPIRFCLYDWEDSGQ
jgi:C2 domain